MGIAAELHSTNPEGKREAGRTAVGMRTGFRKRGYENARADLLDISAKGFKVDTALAPGVGNVVWLRLPGIEPKVAQVKWVDGFIAGCEFHAPMHTAVLDRLLDQLELARRGG